MFKQYLLYLFWRRSEPVVLRKRITWRQVGGKCYHPQPTSAWCLGTGSTIKWDVTFKVIGQLGNCHTPSAMWTPALSAWASLIMGGNTEIRLVLYTNQFTENGNGHIKARSHWQIVFFCYRVLFRFLRRLWRMFKPQYLFPHHWYLLSKNLYQQGWDV